MDVKEYIAKYGETWAIAAIVGGSVGYYSPKQAQVLIKEYLAGKKDCYSERCMALYGGDLEKMLLSDFRYMELVNDEQLISKVKAWIDAELSPVEEMMLSCAFPTL